MHGPYFGNSFCSILSISLCIPLANKRSYVDDCRGRSASSRDCVVRIFLRRHDGTRSNHHEACPQIFQKCSKKNQIMHSPVIVSELFGFQSFGSNWGKIVLAPGTYLRSHTLASLLIFTTSFLYSYLVWGQWNGIRSCLRSTHLGRLFNLPWT